MLSRLATLAILLLAAQSTALAAPLSEEPSRAIYQMYVRAFYDGSVSPDLQGDFAGVEAKVEYLKELGVDTLLLMPVFYSTGDMGYIPRDYFRLDPAYGDDAAFEKFVGTMHANGIKVLLDAPANHISYDSEWFARGSQRRCDPIDVAHDPADPDNQYCDFFYFSADPCNELPYRNWHKPWWWDRTDCKAVWFPRPQFNSAYHRPDKVYATFFSVMPDLKFYDFESDQWNAPVVDAVQRFFDKWARAGVDGFRIDAAKHFVEGRERNNDPQEPRNKELLAKFLSGVRQVNPDVSFVGEIWSGHSEFEPYLPRSLDMVLDFPFMEAVRSSVGSNHGDRFKSVLRHFQARQEQVKPGHRVVFSGNHDVTRLMSEWGDDEQKVRLAHFLTMTQPFTPLLYYGEEIGMHGKVKRPDDTSNEEWVRTIYAFPWDGDDESVGFPGDQKPYTDIPDNYRERNLALARQDPESMFNMVRKLLRVRKDFAVTNETRLYVREDLYGHVIGWTIAHPDRQTGRKRCLSMLTNFDASNTYVIAAAHAAPGCGNVHEEIFMENAGRQGTPDRVMYQLKPYAKIVITD